MPEKLTIELDLTKALGIVPDDLVYVVEIFPLGAADGKIMIGDKIEKVEDDNVDNRYRLFELIEALRLKKKTAKILITRDQSKREEIEKQLEVIKDRRANIVMRNGCHYLIVSLIRDKDKSLGLTLKDFANRVLISKVADDSFCKETLRQYDQICDINNHPVFCRHVAKTMIRDAFRAALNSNQPITMLIARPFSEYALDWTKWAIQQSKGIPPSIRLNEDIEPIVKTQINAMKNEKNIEVRNALKSPSNYDREARLNKDVTVVMIARDVSAQSLIPLPSPSEMSQSFRPTSGNCT